MTDATPELSDRDATQSTASLVPDIEAKPRFELSVEGSLAYAVCELNRPAIPFTHTFVPTSLRGRGIAMRLMLAGLSSSRAQGLQVIPRCPLFRAYMKNHDDTHGPIGAEGRALIEA